MLSITAMLSTTTPAAAGTTGGLADGPGVPGAARSVPGGAGFGGKLIESLLLPTPQPGNAGGAAVPGGAHQAKPAGKRFEAAVAVQSQPIAGDVLFPVPPPPPVPPPVLPAAVKIETVPGLAATRLPVPLAVEARPGAGLSDVGLLPTRAKEATAPAIVPDGNGQYSAVSPFSTIRQDREGDFPGDARPAAPWASMAAGPAAGPGSAKPDGALRGFAVPAPPVTAGESAGSRRSSNPRGGGAEDPAEVSSQPSASSAPGAAASAFVAPRGPVPPLGVLATAGQFPRGEERDQTLGLDGGADTGAGPLPGGIAPPDPLPAEAGGAARRPPGVSAMPANPVAAAPSEHSPVGVRAEAGHRQQEVGETGTTGATAVGGAVFAGVHPVSAGHGTLAFAAPAEGRARAEPTASSDPFRQIDSGGAAPSGLLRASPRMVEVGVNDPAHGWLEIRAQGGSGQIAASLGAVSTEAHAALHSQLAGMAQYLAERDIGVRSLVVRDGIGEGSSGDAGSHASGGHGQSFSGDGNRGSQGGAGDARSAVDERASGRYPVSEGRLGGAPVSAPPGAGGVSSLASAHLLSVRA